jgi:hypothetical protein
MAARKRGETPASPNPRRYLTAYLRSQDLHKQIHRLTKAFEEESTDAEIIRRLAEAQELLNAIQELMK